MAPAPGRADEQDSAQDASGVAVAAKQRTPEWHEQRRSGIGSSDAPIIAGVTPWGDIHELWLQKLGLAPEVEQNEPMRWGRLLEDAVADGYVEMTGNRLRRMNLVQRSREHPWMLASIDRAIIGRRRLVEIKTARFKHDDWGLAGTDQVPDSVKVQVIHQMIVTGYREADVAVLFSGSDLQLYSVGYDQPLADGLVTMEEAFWHYVETRTQPPKVGPVSIVVREDAVGADERITALVAQLRDDRARHAEAGLIRSSTEDALRDAMGDVAMVKGEGFKIIYRPGKERVKVDWQQVARAYRNLIEQHGLDLTFAQLETQIPGGLDTIESVYTRTEAGSRPLIVKWEDQ